MINKMFWFASTEPPLSLFLTFLTCWFLLHYCPILIGLKM